MNKIKQILVGLLLACMSATTIAGLSGGSFASSSYYDPANVAVTGGSIQGVTTRGHTKFNGTVPVMGACGTTPAIVGNDNVMLITVGIGGVDTTCAATFATAWASHAPICSVINDTDRVAYSIVTSTTVITITADDAFTAGSKFHVICKGWN